ncbi:outer membrane beta-barrel family protein [Lacinutrix jangbogonensis]|uniref:outer membrane beta-barrel family protein n=1 Tax=Lacinutrix jangbogonensis TaxID=1469557 RepID=UPI00053E7188|nr:outer membrane beta-barrel family protein [Lacinutrix jangbogonensis]
MKYFLYLLIFLFSSEIIAQQFTISGTLLDENNEPIEYAYIYLMKAVMESETETELIGNPGYKNPKWFSTEKGGFFKFDGLESGDYRITASFMGFETESKDIKLLKNDTIKIILKENIEALEEVTLTSTQPTLKRESDRLVFNVANTALSEGNLLEVLRSTPGVLILDNTITVKNSTPTVYINDRKVNLSASEITQLLENSPANTIKKVEVITNPPAKYDAESGAVLNIVMSRNLITGYRGNLFSNYTQGVFGRYNAGVNQFYKTKKINLNLNYSFTKSKINRENDDRVNYLDNTGDLDEKWQTNNNRNTRSNTHNVNLNFDYFIDSKNTLSFSSNALLVPYYHYRINGKTLVIDNLNERLFNFDAINRSEDEKYNLGFDLDFVHGFENEATLAFNAHLTDYDYQRNQNVNSNYLFPDATNNYRSAFNTNNNQETTIFTSQLDYTLPINDSSEFAFGVKTSNIKTDSDIKQFDINQTTGSSVLDTANTNVYNYEESIFAAYSTFNKSWNRWDFNGGLRVEQTKVDGLSVSNNVKNTQDYFEVFPTLNLSHQVSENASIYSNYKRSISRPSYQLLNPFNFFLNDNTVVTGNPVLKPQLTNKFLLGTGLYDFLTVEVFYKTNDNVIFETPIQDNTTNIITYAPLNINKSNEYGLDIEFYKSITERWFLYAANSLSNTDVKFNLNNTNVEKNKWYNYSILSTDYSFLKDNSLSANLTITRVGANIIGLQTIDTRVVSDLSIRKQLFNKKGTLSLAIADVFNKQDYGVTNRYLNQDSYTFNNEDTRYIKLGFSYKFGNTTLETNERTKELIERDRLEK